MARLWMASICYLAHKSENSKDNSLQSQTVLDCAHAETSKDDLGFSYIRACDWAMVRVIVATEA